MLTQFKLKDIKISDEEDYVTVFFLVMCLWRWCTKSRWYEFHM